MLKLVVTDIDDTILAKGGAISSSMLAAWEECRQAGILRCVATGRVRQGVPDLGQEFTICHGGTLVLAGAKRLYRNAMSIDTARRVWRWSVEQGIDAVLFGEDGWSASFEGKHVEGLARFLGTPPLGEPDWEVPLARLRCPAEPLAAAFPELDIANEGEWTYLRAAFCDKGTALRVLLEHLGLAADEVACFGDDLADLPMFRLCGIAVAVGNARPELKAAATRIAPPVDEDGVTQVLRELLHERR